MGVACEACPLAASLGTRATLELGHLCFLAVLRDSNLRSACLALRAGAWEVWPLSQLPVPFSRLEARLLFRAGETSPLLLLGINIVAYAAHRLCSGGRRRQDCPFRSEAPKYIQTSPFSLLVRTGVEVPARQRTLGPGVSDMGE